MALRILLVTTSLAVARSQASGVDPAIFDDGFCGTRSATPPTRQELSTAAMDCGKLMEFVYVTRLKVWEEVQKQHADYSKASADMTWRENLRHISRASSLMSAHTHFLAAISAQRTECFSEHVRMLLTVNLRRMRAMTTGQVKQLWMVSQDGTSNMEKLGAHSKQWLSDAVDLLNADLKTMKTVLRAWTQPSAEDARFYSHEADGRFSTMEALRRDTFDEYQPDKGLLRGMLRHVFPVDASVADFGAGSGHYAKWLNDTGLVTAYAFDGSPDIELVTKSAVRSADLGKPLQLGQTFDWAICLEVAEHIPPELTPAFLRNLDAHAKEGLVLSWARPGLQGLGNANPKSEQEVLRLVSEHTGLQLDTELTAQLRGAAAVALLAETVMVLSRNPRSSQATCVPGDDTCRAASSGSGSSACGTEEGWIFAGNDVQMFPNVPDSATCCELCRSHEKCRFWTWSREDAHKDLCWIKSTREYRINHDDFVSGVRPA